MLFQLNVFKSYGTLGFHMNHHYITVGDGIPKGEFEVSSALLLFVICS